MVNTKSNSHGEKTRDPVSLTQRAHPSLMQRHHFMVDQQLSLVSFRSLISSEMESPMVVVLSYLVCKS